MYKKTLRFWYWQSFFVLERWGLMLYFFAAAGEAIILAFEPVFVVDFTTAAHTPFVLMNTVAFFKGAVHTLKVFGVIQIFHHFEEVGGHIFEFASQGV